MREFPSVQFGSLLGAAALSLLITAGASAQQQTATTAEARGDSLQEIVVTATKRESTVETTPISITAITGQELQDRGITDIESIVQSVPGVSMRTSGPGQTELEMRGMTSSGGNSSTVGFYLDDTPLTSPASAQNGKVVIDPNLYDLNRIEVLRGPQGTLYGSGSMGGTIKLVPNAPDPSAFASSGQLILGHTSGGDTPNHTENAMLNLPIGDTAALRIVGSLENLSGWINRIVIAYPDFPSPVNGSTRGNVAAAPVAPDQPRCEQREPADLARLDALRTDRRAVDRALVHVSRADAGRPQPDRQPARQRRRIISLTTFPSRSRIGSIWRRSTLNITSALRISPRRPRTGPATRICGRTAAEEIATVLGVPFYPALGSSGAHIPRRPSKTTSRTQWSEEIRLTSAGDTDFKWLAGYFYQDFTSYWNLYVLTPFTTLPGTFNDAFTQIQPTTILQNSFFGEVSYRFFDQLTATVGARRYYYHGTVNTAVSGWLSSSGTT